MSIMFGWERGGAGVRGPSPDASAAEAGNNNWDTVRQCGGDKRYRSPALTQSRAPHSAPAAQLIELAQTILIRSNVQRYPQSDSPGVQPGPVDRSCGRR